MEKKKILIVSKSFYPEISPRSFRTTELVKEFCRLGHDVTLYTLKDNEVQQLLVKEFGFKLKGLGKLRFKNLKLNKNNPIEFLIKRIIKRISLMFLEYPDIELMFKVKKVLKQEDGYDLLISIAVPHPVHWGVAWARKNNHPIAKKWIADCGDAYMGVIKHDSFGKLFYFKYFEKWFCRKADYIAIPNINMRVNYYNEFAHKIVEIPQGFKFEDVANSNKFENNSVPTFAFTGSFIRTTRNPDRLLKYLSQLDIDFKFVIYTNTTELIDHYRSILGNKLVIKNYIPRDELIEEISRMDFLINIGYDPAQQAPSKLIDYQLSGRPILNFITNEIDKQMLNEFLSGNYKNAFVYSDIEKFRIENVCNNFLGHS